jgi:hypothetical protein
MTPVPSPREPDLPDELPEGPVLGSLASETTLEALSLGDVDLRDADAAGVTLRTVRLHGTRLAGARLDGLELIDTALYGCDLANVRASAHAGWIRVRAQTCRMTGLTVGDGLLRDVTLRECRLDLASFAGCRLQRVSFEDCVLCQTDFLEAELDGVRFSGCDLTEVDLRGARLHRCELRDNRLDGLRGVERLRGSAMLWSDIVGGAGLWARTLEIEVLDE